MALTWSKITTSIFAARFCEGGFLFDDAAAICHSSDEKTLKRILGFLNSKCCQLVLNILNPTINIQIGDIGNLPILNITNDVDEYIDENIQLAKDDWDSFETSWDFDKHPLLNGEELIESAYLKWNEISEKRFIKVKENEMKLNEIYIELYGLQGEIDCEVNDEDITVRHADLKREIYSLISYAVGCMFGRFAIDSENGSSSNGNYAIDSDGIIPITDEDYFEDNIVERFIEFIKIAFGEKHLNENLNFIASVLDGKGTTAKEIIRNYFIFDFYKNHCSDYSVTGSGKRPIYWLFDSGKQNGFKVLIYMHRYDRDTVARIRTDYLHKTQSAIENALKNAEYVINTTTSATDRTKAKKAQDKYMKQLAETRIYDQALAYVANQRIEIDLDDGVKHNYELFQNIEISSEGSKKQTINLLAKI